MKKKWFAFLRLSCSVFYISQSLICGFSSRKYHFSSIIPFKCIVFKTYYLILSSFLFKNYLTILIFTVFQSGFHTVLVLFLFSISIPFLLLMIACFFLRYLGSFSSTDFSSPYLFNLCYLLLFSL